jgi:Arc/MetJ-type ribon-helix-helix transcriptional regulator
MKSVSVRLDRFGQDALEDRVRGGGSRADVLQTALHYYLADSDSGRIAWGVPQLARTATSADGVDVELDDDLLARLEGEAQRQDVSIELLAAHAVIYYLTDLDTGRATARLGDAISRDAQAK